MERDRSPSCDESKMREGAVHVATKRLRACGKGRNNNAAPPAVETRPRSEDSSVRGGSKFARTCCVNCRPNPLNKFNRHRALFTFRGFPSKKRDPKQQRVISILHGARILHLVLHIFVDFSGWNPDSRNVPFICNINPARFYAATNAAVAEEKY